MTSHCAGIEQEKREPEIGIGKREKVRFKTRVVVVGSSSSSSSSSSISRCCCYVAARRHICFCFMAKSAFWRGFSALAPYTGVGPI